IDRGNGRIIVSMPGNSRLSLTHDVRIALNSASQALQGSIPISIRGGSTSITSPSHSLLLQGINGNMTLNLNDKGMSLSGKLNTTLEAQPKAMGGLTTCGVKIGSLRIAPASGHMQVELNDCQLAIPRATLQQLIVAKLPQTRTFQVNKELL